MGPMSHEEQQLRERNRMSEQFVSEKIVDATSGVITDNVDLKTLPQFQELSDQVQSVLDSSSWWNKYGVDWCLHLGAILGWFGSPFLLASSNPAIFTLGVILLGGCHSCLAMKAAHCSVHKSLCQSQVINKIMCYFCSDFIGTFSTDVGYNIHIKVHHPHTNIIGLGDSSTWKAPFVPSMLYMFVTPLLLPILTPLVSLKELLQVSPLGIPRFLLIASAGLGLHVYLLVHVSNLSYLGVLLVIFASRNVVSIPYIHVNIFQHIGLPMYSQNHRPKRLYQMTSGVLNLDRNRILEFCFGHSIISCHVEHHLFPRLSDNMCFKVKPLVKAFCQQHGLPYHEDTYAARTKYFLDNYTELMVKAPPITKFVGLQ